MILADIASRNAFRQAHGLPLLDVEAVLPGKGADQQSTVPVRSPLLPSIRRKASYSGPGPFTARKSSTGVSIACPPDAGFGSCRTLRPDGSLINRQQSPFELR
jgi:hypothetical protein